MELRIWTAWEERLRGQSPILGSLIGACFLDEFAAPERCMSPGFQAHQANLLGSRRFRPSKSLRPKYFVFAVTKIRVCFRCSNHRPSAPSQNILSRYIRTKSE